MNRAVLVASSFLFLQACASVETASTPEFDMIPSEELAAVQEQLDRENQQKEIVQSLENSNQAATEQTTQESLTAESQAEEPQTLLQRVASQFTWDTMAETPRVARYVDQYRGNPELFNAILSRSRPYLYYVAEQIEHHNMPTELAFLPFVESGYNPIASSSASAVGLWQFMPATAQQYGIQSDWWYEGRADIVDSTETALFYLRYLHEKFGGDWELALAAYNGGEGYLSRTILATGRQDYWSLDLHTETENYVPKLLAIVEIIGNAEKYAMGLPQIEDESKFEIVKLDSQIDLNKVAELAELERPDLIAYNPGFLRWATPPGDEVRLLIPSAHVDRFNQRVALLPESERVSFQQYRIQSGDNLSTIAQRYGTSVNAIMAANNMDSTLIRAGRDLLIPYGQTSEDMIASLGSSGTSRIYIVQSGDSL